MPPPIALSKTRLLSYLQCPKKLWLEQYSPELEDEDAIDWAAIAVGREVGDVARQVYANGGGHRVSNDRGLRSAIAQTAAALAEGADTPIFEATFDHDGVTVQVDVLDRSTDPHRIVEVKSSARLKDHYLPDCAIQWWALTESGSSVSAAAVAHIDTAFVYSGDGYEGLFTETDVTAAVGALLGDVPAWVAGTREVLDQLDEPEAPIGPHCRKPHPCPFFAHCAPASGEYPVSALGGSRDLHDRLLQDGYSDLREVPAERLETERQRRIRAATIAGEPHVDPELGAFAAALEFPRYYLDFETIAFAIPRWPDTRPFEAIPFQWSCHKEAAAGQLKHDAFLDLSGAAPMRACAESLLATIGEHGPVVVYTGYEGQVLRGLADRFEDLAAGLLAIEARLVDLHEPVKAHYYHPDMLGSWSMKAVLPTIAPDLDYAALGAVADGRAAQIAYREAIDPATTPARREEIRRALLEYCRLDTLGLARLVAFCADG